MIHILDDDPATNPLAASMFADRKHVFVDLLGWTVPVLAGRFEIDQYDGPDATYLVAVDEAGAHEGSLRLLPTSEPHILGDLFSRLCVAGVPRGERIHEITRLCLPSRLGATRRLHVRNLLISAMVDHALDRSIDALTGVVSSDFRDQVLAMGWRCASLGPAELINGSRVGAFRIDIDEETPALLAANGIYSAGALAPPAVRKAA